MQDVTLETFAERIKEREMIDFLNSKPHPVKEMDDSGYTYYDYVVYRFNNFKRPVKMDVEKINELLAGKGEVRQWSNGISLDKTY